MGIGEPFGDSAPTDEGTDDSTCWCTACGMLFARSSPDVDYAWCARCGAEEVRRLPWPNAE
jgi:hypothetical protein